MEQGDVWSPVDSPSEGAARRFVAAARAAAGNRQRDDLGDEVGDNGTTTAGAVAGCSWTPGMRKDPLRAGMVARPEKARLDGRTQGAFITTPLPPWSSSSRTARSCRSMPRNPYPVRNRRCAATETQGTGMPASEPATKKD